MIKSSVRSVNPQKKHTRCNLELQRGCVIQNLLVFSLSNKPIFKKIFEMLKFKNGGRKRIPTFL